MEDEDFRDLFGEAELLRDSARESLTDAPPPHQDNHAPAQGFQRQSRREDRVYPNADVIDKIEDMLEPIVDAMLNEKDQYSITLRTRNRTSSSGTRQLRFPAKTADEAWRFAVVVRILELMHEALRNDAVISKRDLYYRDPALFGYQSTVDRYVDDIALTFGVPRSSLNVTAVAKGLLAGAVSFCRKDGSTVDAFNDREGILVPSLKDVLSVMMQNVRWILVIEKEASFRSIAASSFWDVISARGIIITGKGYPDLSTRAMLHFLVTPSARNGFVSPPVFGLVDFDPDGIAILSIYRHGSQSLAHESKKHAVPQLQWLGLRSEHLALGHGAHLTQGLLTLTPRDRRKALDMLANRESLRTSDGWETGHELQRMLQMNTKAEIQLLDAVPDGMAQLLRSTLCKL
ncbi:Meiotic recombination SPO11 [Lecanosticta acicola]|uniref:DNA topoisomerase (ATP-hydrolyzing) n=1 Tax=Lecanosticta acicola TaxID=111012 RepID=A0AAI8YZ31_9PEZI|nr:Meiotic recombination SPO11 [Lecanosticta acicola]